MSVTLYHYPGCSTCRSARTWLARAGIEVQAIDIVATPPSSEQLRSCWERSGLPLKRLFNTSGMSYRAGGFGARLPSMSDDEQLAALAADGKLIKRPLLITPDAVVVGFKPADYEAALGAD